MCISNSSLYHTDKCKYRYLNLKFITVIYPITGWLEITKYDDKNAISIANLVETTRLARYHRPEKLRMAKDCK